MGTKKQSNQAIQDQTDPEIDQQTQIRPKVIAAMLGRRGEMGH